MTAAARLAAIGLAALAAFLVWRTRREPVPRMLYSERIRFALMGQPQREVHLTIRAGYFAVIDRVPWDSRRAGVARFAWRQWHRTWPEPRRWDPSDGGAMVPDEWLMEPGIQGDTGLVARAEGQRP